MRDRVRRTALSAYAVVFHLLQLNGFSLLLIRQKLFTMKAEEEHTRNHFSIKRLFHIDVVTKRVNVDENFLIFSIFVEWILDNQPTVNGKWIISS